MEKTRDLDQELPPAPFGTRRIIVVSATSCAIATLTPPSSWIRSAICSGFRAALLRMTHHK